LTLEILISHILDSWSYAPYFTDCALSLPA